MLQPSFIPDFHPENLENTKEKFLKYGVTPISLDLSFCCHEARKEKREISALENEFKIASALNIPYIRVFGNRLRDGTKADYEDILYALKGACKMAAAYGLSVLLEVHGDFNNETTLKPILDEMKYTKNFGLIWDIGHTDLVYKENWKEFYLFAKPFIKHVHIKDHKRNPLTHLPVGSGEIPIFDILKCLKNDSFCGCISLEWERCWHRELCKLEEVLGDFISLSKEV